MQELSLIRLIQSVSHLHRTELTPVAGNKLELRLLKDKLELPKHEQILLFSDSNDSKESTRDKVASARSQLIGHMYELLIATFYGGKLLNNPLNITIPCKEGNETINVMPDVVDFRNNKFWESKCIANGRRLPLRDDQGKGYNALQKIKPYPTINFMIWKHSVDEIKLDLERSAESLLEEVCSSTSYAIVLPMSLIAEFADLNKLEVHSDLVYRYAPEKIALRKGRTDPDSRHCVYVKNPALYTLLKSPEEIIKQLGLNPEDYLFNRLISPSDFHVNKYLLKQFPILEITDKNHEKWAKRFDEYR